MFLVLFFLSNMIYILVKIVHPKKKETKDFFSKSLRLTTGREEFSKPLRSTNTIVFRLSGSFHFSMFAANRVESIVRS